MAFTTFTVAPRGPAAGSGFAASLKKLRGAAASLSFSIRAKVAAELGWSEGDMLLVQIGDEEHHGLVRLRKDPAGTAKVSRREAGKTATTYYAIVLGHVPAFVNRAEPKKWCSYEMLDGEDEGWVEVVLPTWSDETGARRHRPALPGPQSVPQLALAPPPRADAGRMPGDPPPGRSALEQRQASVPTRGQARRAAELREAPQFVAAEAIDRQRRDDLTDRAGALQQAFGLTGTEVRYLRCLLDGRLKTKETLLEIGHDESEHVEIKMVDVYIHKLRKKLKTQLVEIETVWGQGYRMAPEMAARVLVLLDGSTQQRAAS